MHILLPPSETKRLGGRLRFSGEQLLGSSELNGARTRVRQGLERVSVHEAAATSALKLGVKNRDERLHNLQLDTSGALPAAERYTGVLYDALFVDTLPRPAREWLDASVYVQSALFGLVRACDPIPAYRLSASSRLPDIGTGLAKVWAPVHEGALAEADYVLDLRSKDYAALAPLASLGARSTDYLDVLSRSENGEVRALNHFNKAAKGDLVRRLALSAPAIESREDLLEWAMAVGLDIQESEAAGSLRLVTEQGVPASSS